MEKQKKKIVEILASLCELEDPAFCRMLTPTSEDYIHEALISRASEALENLIKSKQLLKEERDEYIYLYRGEIDKSTKRRKMNY